MAKALKRIIMFKSDALIITIIYGLVLVGFAISLKIGPVPVSLIDALAAVTHPVWDSNAIIMWDLRLPRSMMCVLVGGALALAGAALQSFLRNPLAEPSIVGISSTAALGAVISIVSGFHAFGALSTPGLAFVGGLAGGIVLASAAFKIKNTNNLILVGVGISSISGAVTSLILSLSDNPFAINEIVFWMLGSLTDVSLFHTAIVTPFVLVGGALLLGCRRDLNLLSLGGDTAATIGVVMNSLKYRVVIGTALTVSAVTAIVGIIGFIGLMTPHIARPLARNEPGKTLAYSIPIGALIVLLADIAVRLTPTAGEMKLGVFTALLGTPFFLYLIKRQSG